MNMDITRFAIEKNRIFLALLVVVLVSGIAAYRDMPRDEDPGPVARPNRRNPRDKVRGNFVSNAGDGSRQRNEGRGALISMCRRQLRGTNWFARLA